MAKIKLIDAVTYYRALPHQVDAWSYLDERMPDGVREKFQKLYRNTTFPARKPDYPLIKTVPVLLQQRIKELGITLPAPNVNYDRNLIVVGLSGINTDFSVNNNEYNHFNDLFLIVNVGANGQLDILCKAVGTTSPGHHYTYNPLNINGAANVLEDKLHENIWKVGIHGRGKSAHEALLQTGNQICVSRDKNKDFNNSGDLTSCGFFEINFHWGYDYPLTNISRASAGCQVIRLKEDFTTAMNYLKSDGNYQKNKQHCFSYLLLNGKNLIRDL